MRMTKEEKNARKRERYRTDPVFREKEKAASVASRKKRYNTDPVFREKEKNRTNDLYKNDPKYRAMQLARVNNPCRDKMGEFVPCECYLCGTLIEKSEDAHVDHIHPRSRGGSDKLNNLAWVHIGCNYVKTDKLLSEMDLPIKAP